MTLAITYAAAGDPADVLATTEIPDPPPPEPGQVQIKVRAFRSTLETSPASTFPTSPR